MTTTVAIRERRDAKFKKLTAKLSELFQMDQAELDFGIYRIMNAKRKRIEEFLKQDLLPQVRKALSGVENADALEGEVYDHLLTFFSRYYKEGDFISQRRYGRDEKYAIPYNGEEVKLHWANHNQYYIKSSERLKNYAFTVEKDGKKRRVQFEIVKAVPVKDNNKADRYYVVSEKEPARVEGGDLVVQFEHRAIEPKEVGQKTQRGVNVDRVNSISLECLKSWDGYADWQGRLEQPAPTGANKKRTLIEKHLAGFVKSYTFDYFIHNDLDGFLRRELDFYIKNEVFRLDDVVEQQNTTIVKGSLQKVRALRKVAGKIITFLAQLENFQKRLFEKKKFVIETNYCITLDRVPEEFYPEILRNDEQIKAWFDIYAIEQWENGPASADEIDEDFLRRSPCIMLDTGYFEQQFMDHLFDEFDDVDAYTDGYLLQSDNFQAMRLLRDTFTETVECVCIDPPYNTGEDGFPYKDSHFHSTWLTMIWDRVKETMPLMTESGSFWATIDDNELIRFQLALEELFGPENHVANVIWQKRTSPDARATVGAAHDYVVTYAKSYTHFKAYDRKKELTEDRKSSYTNPDDDPRGPWASVDLTGQTGHATESQFYEIETPDGTRYAPPSGRCWALAESTFHTLKEEGRIWFGQSGNSRPRLKKYLSESDGMAAWTWWPNSEVGHNQEAKKELNSFFKGGSSFSTPKPTRMLKRILSLADSGHAEFRMLDTFAGSGSSAQAVIDLNREDNGNRKYTLVEMGEYFDTVLKPRIQKTVFSKDWDDGVPQFDEAGESDGVSHMFKYQRLESYEDALNNLKAPAATNDKQRTLDQHQQEALKRAGQDVREEYMLSYMLDVETEGSASLLDLDAFRDPFNYKLKIIRNDETRWQNVDLVETFNYLIGLRMKTYKVDDGVTWVTGTVRSEVDDEPMKVVVLWRNVDEVDNDALDDWFQTHVLDAGVDFDVVYVNGDCNLAALRGRSNWQVGLTEEEFKERMFDTSDAV